MAVRETSRDSYKKLTDLGDRQQEVFTALKQIEPASDRDIAQLLDDTINQITPRRGELEQYGFVVRGGHKFDQITKRRVIAWVTTNPMAQRQIDRVAGKIKPTKEKESVQKYTLKLKDGKVFTINEEMKNEVEASLTTQRGFGGTISLATHTFRLADIIIPIRAQGAEEELAEIKKEETRTEILVEVNNTWQEATETEMAMRRKQRPFRRRKIGLETGQAHDDWLIHFPDGYETMRDMKRADS